MKFYSKGGKKRLRKIWKENKLDEETIFSGWLGIGPSRNLIYEKVSDYMQNFYQFINKSEYLRMNLRLMLMHRTIVMNAPQNSMWNFKETTSQTPRKVRNLSFQSVSGAHHDEYNATVEQRVKAREIQEKKRIRKLIIEGKMKPPEGFKSALLRLNAIDEKVQQLERLEASKHERLSFRSLPKIINYDENVRKSNRSKMPRDREDKEERILAAYEKWDDLLENIALSKRPSRDSTKQEDILMNTNVVQDISETSVDNKKKFPPTPTVQIQIQQYVENNLDEEIMGDRNFEEVSSSWHKDEDRSRSYGLDIKDDEIFAEAASHNYYGVTGEIEYSMDFPILPLLVGEAVEEKIVTSMFEKAEEAVRAYRRQVLTANDKMKKLQRLINPYYFYV